MRNILIFLFSFLYWPSASAEAGPLTNEPSTEARALWVTRFAYKTPQDVKAIIQNAASHNFNMLFFQVRGYATDLYPSQYEPWAEELGGEYPGWDPLRTAIYEAHKAGLQIHAWVNVYPGWRSITPPTAPIQLWNLHSHWFMTDEEGHLQELNPHYVWLAPTVPQVKDHLYKVFMELVQEYDIDGLHFDYIRFPGPGYSHDSASLNQFISLYGDTPQNLPKEWDEWRRGEITDLLERIHNDVTKIKPYLIFSAAVVGGYERGKNIFLQDSHRWLAQGVLDMIFPMLETSDSTLFLREFMGHLPNSHGRWVFPGIYYIGSPEAALHQIEKARSLGTKGHCLYSYRKLFPSHKPGYLATRLKSEFYKIPAQIPRMPWKLAEGSKDVVGPLITHIAALPSVVREGQPFRIFCTITDPSGVHDDDTGSQRQGVYLIWNADGGLTGGHEVTMSKVPGSKDFFITDKPIPPQPLFSNFTFRIFAWDNRNNLGYSDIETLLINFQKDIYLQEGTFGPLIPKAQSIAVDPAGKVWVASGVGNCLRVVNPDGSEAEFSPITHGLNSQGDLIRIQNPTGIGIDRRGVVYAAGSRHHIFKLSCWDGMSLTGFETTFFPGGMALDGQSHLFIIEAGGSRWHVLDTSGNELRGSPIGGSHINQGIAVAKDGKTVYVACRSEGTVHRWTGGIENEVANYSLDSDLPISGVGIGTVDIDGLGNIYVSQTPKRLVTILDREENIIGYLFGGNPPLRAPQGVGFNSDSSVLYILEIGVFSPVRLQKWVKMQLY